MNDDFEKKNENSPEEDLPGESIASSEENAQETGAFDAKTESAYSQ